MVTADVVFGKVDLLYIAQGTVEKDVGRVMADKRAGISGHLRQGAADAHGVRDRRDALGGVGASPVPIDAAKLIVREIDLRTSTQQM